MKNVEHIYKFNRTDQFYTVEKTDSSLIISNQSLKFICGDKTNLFFNNESEGFFNTKIYDCYTHLVIEFIDYGYSYFFFRVYSNDRSY